MKLPPPSIADTYDQQPTPTPMTRLEAIEYIVSRTDFDYPETPFRRRDPYTVTLKGQSYRYQNLTKYSQENWAYVAYLSLYLALRMKAPQ